MNHLGQPQKFIPRIADKAERPSFSFRSNEKMITLFAVSTGAMMLGGRKNTAQ